MEEIANIFLSNFSAHVYMVSMMCIDIQERKKLDFSSLLGIGQ